MKTYIATSGNQSFTGSSFNCLVWAHKIICEFPDAVVKIHYIRPEQKFLILIAEVTSSGVRRFTPGRIVNKRSFMKKFGNE